MDYMYDFRQAQLDRLEDAGVISYRNADTNGFARRRPNRQRRSPLAALRRRFATLSQVFVLK